MGEEFRYIEEQKFNGHNFTENPLIKGEYENCIFANCDFSNCDLSGFKFIDCEFERCNLSMLLLDTTMFQNINFKDNKMLGLQFDSCNSFGLSFRFDSCQLNHTSFFKTNIKGTIFKDCQLHSADFGECQLSGTIFDHCDLDQAIFDYSNLEKCDFRTSINYSIDPESNQIKKAKFSLSGISGLLRKYDIQIED